MLCVNVLNKSCKPFCFLMSSTLPWPEITLPFPPNWGSSSLTLGWVTCQWGHTAHSGPLLATWTHWVKQAFLVSVQALGKNSYSKSSAHWTCIVLANPCVHTGIHGSYVNASRCLGSWMCEGCMKKTLCLPSCRGVSALAWERVLSPTTGLWCEVAELHR